MEEELFANGQGADVNVYDDHQYHLTEQRKNSARRHGMMEEIEMWQRQRHDVKHVEALGLQNQALLADQQAAEMEAKLVGEQEGEQEGAQEPQAGQEPEAGMEGPEGAEQGLEAAPMGPEII